MTTHANQHHTEQRKYTSKPLIQPTLQKISNKVLDSLLNAIQGQVIAFDADGYVHGANAAAKAHFGDDIYGMLAGDVIRCDFSKLPRGCGHTEFCDRCTFRTLLTLTVEENHAFSRITLPWRLEGKTHTAVVSTIPLKNLVLVHIHDVGPVI